MRSFVLPMTALALVGCALEPAVVDVSEPSRSGAASSDHPVVATAPLTADAAPLATAASATTAARAIDQWPQFRGAGGQGVSPARNLPVSFGENEHLAWKIALPGAGASTPVTFGSQLILTCYSGYNVPGQAKGDMNDLRLHLLAFDKDTGEQRWRTDLAPRLPEQDTIRDEHGYATSTPAVDAERIYCFFGKTGAIAFDHQGGELWRTDVGSGLSGWGSAASVVLHENLVFINASVESESLVALDRATGREVWRARGVKESWSTPLVATTADGRPELVVAMMGKLVGYEPATGETLWTCDTDIPWYMVPCPVAHDGIVYCIGGRTGGALAVRTGGRGDVTRSHRVWTGTRGSNVSSPVLHEGRLYWMHENQGIVHCAAADTGASVYQERLPRAGQCYSAALLADGRIYYLTRDGRIYVVAAEPQFRLLATNELPGRTVFNSSPSAADGRLYIRSNHHLYCFAAP